MVKADESWQSLDRIVQALAISSDGALRAHRKACPKAMGLPLDQAGAPMGGRAVPRRWFDEKAPTKWT